MDIAPIYFLTLEAKGEILIKYDKTFAEELAKQAKAEIRIIKDLEVQEEIYIVQQPIEYYSNGRMKFNPMFLKKGIPWSSEDLEYLVEWYDIVGPEEMSFALERTINSVMQKVNELRRKGIMKCPPKRVYSERIKKKRWHKSHPLNKKS